MTFSIDFTKPQTQSQLIDLLQKNEFWLYAWPAASTTLKEEHVYDRIDTKHNALELTLYASDGAVFGKHLNPRTELRCPHMMEWETPHVVEAVVTLLPETKAEFIQVIGRTRPDNRARPIVQLEIRDGWFCVRYAREDGSLFPERIHKGDKLYNKKTKFRVEFHVQKYLRVFVNETKVYEDNNDLPLGDSCIQFGLYGNRPFDKDMKVLYHSLAIDPKTKPTLKRHTVKVPRDADEILLKFV